MNFDHLMYFLPSSYSGTRSQCTNSCASFLRQWGLFCLIISTFICLFVEAKSQVFYSDSVIETTIAKSVESSLKKNRNKLTLIALINEIPLAIIDTSYTQHYPGILRSVKIKYSDTITVEIFIKYSGLRYPDSVFRAPLYVSKYSNCLIDCIKILKDKKLLKVYGICKKMPYRKT